MKYLLATRYNLLYHHNYLSPYFKSKYNVVQETHISGKEAKKTESTSIFLFTDIDEELKTELKDLGFEWTLKEKLVKLN